jgi:iron complex outermembrane receptor protein
LTVRVLDPSGAAVPKANVTITHRTTQETRTRIAGDSGESIFEEVRPGFYIVQADAQGFGASEVKQVDIQSQGRSSVELTLDLARLTTHVQVTAAGTAQTVDEQSKALDVIDKGEMDRRLEYSVAEAVRAVAGIRVQQFGGPGSLVRILARGMRPSDTSVLVDGFRFRDAAAPQGDVSAFAGDLLIAGASRIEVLRGSGSSLYGTHATGGIVNVITDQGGGAFRGEIGAEGGGLSVAQGFARFSGGAWSDRLRYSGAAQHLNVMKGLDGDDRARNSVGQVFVHGQIGSRTAIQGRLLASDNFAQLNDSPYDIPAGAGTSSGIIPAEPYRTFVPSSNDPDMRRAGDYFSGLVSLSHALTSRAFTRLSFHHVTTGRDTRDGPAGTRFEPLFNDLNRFDGDIDTVEARTDLQLQNHLITAGYEFERERFDNVSQDENPDQAARVDAQLQIAQHSHTAFVHDQMRLLDERLLVSLSGRMQQFELEHPAFSGQNAPYQGVTLQTPPRAWTGDASVSHFWRNSGTKLRAHVGNSYRAPALFERFGASFFFGSFSAFGDPNLAPERIIAFDAGADQYFAGSRVRLSGTYFYTRLQEAIVFDFSGLIVPDTDPYGRFGGYRNTGGGIARGIELTVEARPSRSTTLRTAYTYTNADERSSVFRDGTLRSVRVSDHMLTVTGTQRIARNLDVTADVFAASNYLYGFGDRAFEFEGPIKADIAAVYTLNFNDRRALQIYTRLENILNRTYFEDGFSTPKAWAVAGMKLRF